MTSRLRWTLALLTLLGVLAAGAWFYGFTLPGGPTRAGDRAESRRPPAPSPVAAEGASPEALAPSARNEIDCVDRLLQMGAPAGADLKAEWERCAALGEAAQNRIADESRLERDAARRVEPAGNGADPRR